LAALPRTGKLEVAASIKYCLYPAIVV